MHTRRLHGDDRQPGHLNVPEVQKGLKVLARTQDSIPLASSYQESRIRHFHHTLTKWIENDATTTSNGTTPLMSV
jgi:hypothetical protein